ncbi:uncharacterized protein LOC593133 [Strongylocentrotus purpuratus]|uniref:Sulfotransferase n=1 Tax=Strongylocentrotus purpuratus TaxID=7668 RepID=A0A7M7NFI1_STRPU|nr:uncharacterized protein LOC593133 [Strongylocentrotus purpuratus]XP_030835799.1 uncharacterized protein LOC593133 [Strongylocentrotus purpuratus]|eukprot:XP_797716.1 PREDICTED: uncharacterized protein LOC593133 [Strongylocentrotus purpuratus]
MSDTKPFRVIMWCVPRSISTAIAKCFSFVDNTEVWFEPYCLAFFQDFMLKNMGVPLPRSYDDFKLEAFFTQMGAMLKGTPMEHLFTPEKIDGSLFIRDGVTRQLDDPSEKPIFIKDMAYGITGYLDLLPKKETGFKHTFLLRDPERMFPSWRNLLMAQMAQMPTPGQKPIDPDTFDMTTDVPFMMPGYTYKCQYDLWKHVKENLDPNPVVIDVDELLSNPAEMLPKYFEACGMPWDAKYLQWEGAPDIVKKWRCLFPMSGTKADDIVGVTHKNALESSAFRASKPKIPRSEMTPDTIKAIDATVDYYKEMAETRIKL